MITTAPRSIGTPLRRLEGREKVTGQARYAFEHSPEQVAYASPVQAAIARGAIRFVDPRPALSIPGVLAVISPENAPALASTGDGELALFQSNRVSYRGQFIAACVADTLETAREAANLVRIEYDPEPHAAELTSDHPRLYKPETVNPGFATDTESGDLDSAFARAAVTTDHTYTTPAYHNNPMEPHAATAFWDDGALTVYDSNQGTSIVAATLAQLFEISPQQVRVISPHVGGGFGSKGTPRPQVVLAALAARITGRPVKVAVTRQQMFAVVGYRTPTIQRVRLAAGRDGTIGAICHDVVEQTSTIKEFAEQTAIATRHMYAASNLRTTHRLAPLDVPSPSWMRAPGECPGMFALESAIDELATSCGVDPVELRIRNEPRTDQQGRRFSSRNLVACLRRGAERFGWSGRDPRPAMRRVGGWYVGTGVAASTYPAYLRPSSASARAEVDGTYTVRLAAQDIGTGSRTALTQIAADALEVPPEAVRLAIGDSSLPWAPLAGGSLGTASWGYAITKACRALLDRIASEHAGVVPNAGLEASADTAEEVEARAAFARHAFGAQFVEARVRAETGEVRVARMLGVFAAGRIINPTTARSQFIGGMTMGLSMALHEEGIMDARFGHYVNRDFANYHISSLADVAEIEAEWVDEDDPHLNPMASKGIGEIGIVGTAAAIANATFNATGIRVRDLPITLDKLLS